MYGLIWTTHHEVSSVFNDVTLQWVDLNIQENDFNRFKCGTLSKDKWISQKLFIK